MIVYMSSNSFDTTYNQRVRDKSRKILREKISSEPQTQHYYIPSVFSANVAFKDRRHVLPDMSKMGSVLSDRSGTRYLGGRDTSSGGRDTSSGGGMCGCGPIGLAKPRTIGSGFWGDLKNDLSHPKQTLQGIGRAKTWSDALKKSGQIIGTTLEKGIPLGAAAMTAAETGSPAAAIGSYKESKGFICFLQIYKSSCGFKR